MIRHGLKIWTADFDAVASGRKTVELRKDDRNYAVGDTLILREYQPIERLDSKYGDGHYTGREIWVTITHALRDEQYLQSGYVALSIQLDRHAMRLAALERLYEACVDRERNGGFEEEYRAINLALDEVERLEMKSNDT